MKLADPTTLPSGVLTIMFTDIEDSTSRWESDPSAMRRAMTIHDALLADVIVDHGGMVFKGTGDGAAAVFASVDQAALAAVEIQRRIQTDEWPETTRLKVRIGLHLGEIEPTDGDYYGPPVNRAARIADVANGDQITASTVAARFIQSVRTRSMGEHQLKGIGTESIDVVLDPSLIADERPLRSTVSRAVKPLPVPPQRLIGRERDVQQVLAMLEASAAVTIVGLGGVGKTRFAIEVGRELESRLRDGAVFCELAPAAGKAAVMESIAKAMGARQQPGMTLRESIADFLEGREMLLVIDHCEHVLDAVRDLGRFVEALPGVQLLTTSRERIRFANERVFTLEPLEIEPAVELFVERASARDFGYRPDAVELDTIADICRRVDGIPLGIELAAAWTSILSTGQLLDRLSDRFSVVDPDRPEGGGHNLRETVTWSYDQLDPTEAEVFARLSVFSGGFSFGAASAVCGHDDLVDGDALLQTLRVLVDKSMIRSQRGAGEIRFTMLDTLRQFGSERLADAGSVEPQREAHAEYFVELAGRLADRLVSADEAEVWDQLDREWANIRTAFTTLVEWGRIDEATDLVLGFGWFAALSLRFELFGWAETLADQPGFSDRAGAGSVLGLIALHRYFTIDGESIALAERGLDTDPADPYGFCHISLAANSLNNVHTAEESEALTAAWLDRIHDDTPMLSRLWALGMRVFHICTHAPSSEGAERHRELMRIANTTGSASAMAIARWAGGMLATFESIDAGLSEWDKGLDAARSISDVHLLVHLIVGLQLHFTAARGDLDEVLERCLAILDQAHDQHYMTGTSHLFGVTAILLARVERAETGAALLGTMNAHGHLPRTNATRAIDKALGADAAEAMAEGADLSFNDAVAMASRALRAAIAERAAGATTGSTPGSGTGS